MPTMTKSHNTLKRAFRPRASSSASIIESTEASMSSDNELSQKQKRRKREKRTRTRTMPTKNHSIARDLSDAYEKWENGLMKGKDKLYKSEMKTCVEIIMKYGKSKSFPDSDEDYPPLLLARSRKGWELFRASKEFRQQHPEVGDQCKRNGKWFFTESCLW